MNTKFKLTKKFKMWCGIKLWRIKALKDFNGIKKGELGGFVEKEQNLSSENNAWVYGDAQVYGNAWLSGDAEVSGDARVYGSARVSGNAWVSSDAEVYGNARVYGNAWVSSDARVYGNARVYGDAQVYGDARVYGDAWVYGKHSINLGHFFDTKHKGDNIQYVKQNKTERWVEEFDRRFPTSYAGLTIIPMPIEAKAIKSFISQLLSDARREERERCLEALPKKKNTSVIAQAELVQRPEWNKKYNLMELRYLVKGYNQALTTAEESIKKLDQISQSIK